MSLDNDAALPPTYVNEINSLTGEILKTKPTDVLQFCSNFFQKRLESQRVEHLTTALLPLNQGQNNTAMAENSFPGFAQGGSNPFGSRAANNFGGIREEAEHDDVDPASPTSSAPPITSIDSAMPPPTRTPFGGGFIPSGTSSAGGLEVPAGFNAGRRTSVSAEAMNPNAASDNWSPPDHAKTAEQMARLQTAVSGNFLFSHLSEEQMSQVLGALVEKPIPIQDMRVISQGDEGDNFYVVEKGDFDVYVNPAGVIQPGPEGMGKKVATIGRGGSFGELALMYNAPRAATVISTAPSSVLWALDRITFRRILMENTSQRRKMFEAFLGEVKLFASMSPYERSKVADALDTITYPADSTIINEGDPGDAFFLLESGEAAVYKRGESGPVHRYQKGDYFGELALLNDAPRAASVVSTSKVKVASLKKDAFARLLGPLEGIMRRDDPSKRPSVGSDAVMSG